MDKINELRKRWTGIPLSGSKANDMQALMQLDNDMNDWFNELEEALDELKDTLREIIDQLNSCNYTCEAGPLEKNASFITLCELVE